MWSRNETDNAARLGRYAVALATASNRPAFSMKGHESLSSIGFSLLEIVSCIEQRVRAVAPLNRGFTMPVWFRFRSVYFGCKYVLGFPKPNETADAFPLAWRETVMLENSHQGRLSEVPNSIVFWIVVAVEAE
jgi:hypothetical protein